MIRKILYRLITRDGIKSEIKEMDSFMPEVTTALPVETSVSSMEIKEDYHVVSTRRYKLKRNDIVDFVEYEEV
jgi:hypothetical protein